LLYPSRGGAGIHACGKWPQKHPALAAAVKKLEYINLSFGLRQNQKAQPEILSGYALMFSGRFCCPLTLNALC